MKGTRMILRTGSLAILTIIAGCGSDDGRLAEYAKNSVEQQTRQNDQIARQNLEITRQNQQVAEAARNLVEADARARQEMIAAQESLQAGIQSERQTLDHQRHELELERKDIARQRYWDPVIAHALSGSVALLACLLPLAICVYVLRNLYHDRGDDAALNEMLVQELTTDRPRFLLPPGENSPVRDEGPSPNDTPRIDSKTDDSTARF
jgi:hypothetical protein